MVIQKQVIFNLLILILLKIVSPIYAQPVVLINEFSTSSTPQKVEVINIGSKSADISGWFIDDSGGKSFFTIPDATILEPNSCAVFEGNFYFNKTTRDTVRLFDKTAVPTSTSAKLIDYYTYTQNLSPQQSFSRLPDGQDWTVINSTFGLFNQTKISCIKTPTLTPTNTPVISDIPTPTKTEFLTPTPTQSPDYDNIIISEVEPNPDTDSNEWVELFNNNSFEVQLTNWYIDDVDNSGSTPYKFSLTINPFSYAIVDINSSMFNNGGDSVRLLSSTKQEKDSMRYGYSKRGKSWGRKEMDISSLFCLQNPSPNQENNQCIKTENKNKKIIPTQTQVKKSRLPFKSSLSKEKQPKYYFTNQNQVEFIISEHSQRGSVLGKTTKTESKNSRENDFYLLPLLYSSLTLVSALRKILK